MTTALILPVAAQAQGPGNGSSDNVQNERPPLPRTRVQWHDEGRAPNDRHHYSLTTRVSLMASPDSNGDSIHLWMHDILSCETGWDDNLKAMRTSVPTTPAAFRAITMLLTDHGLEPTMEHAGGMERSLVSEAWKFYFIARSPASNSLSFAAFTCPEELVRKAWGPGEGPALRRSHKDAFDFPLPHGCSVQELHSCTLQRIGLIQSPTTIN